MKAKLAVSAMTAVTVFWGGAFVGIKILLEDLDYQDLTLARFVISAALLALLLPFFKPKSPVQRKDWPLLILLGALGVGGYHLALNYGELTVSAGVASLIIASVPALVALLSRALLKEEITRRRALGIALALGGVALLAIKGTPGTELELGSVLGAAVTAIAPLAWAFNTVLSKPLAHRLGPTPLTIIMVIAGTVLLLPLIDGDSWRSLSALDAEGWFWMAFLVLPCTVAGYLAWFWAVRYLDATRTAAFVYLVPVWALIWAWAILGERPSTMTILGGGLVLGGVYLVQNRKSIKY